MARIVVSIRHSNNGAGVDVEVPTDLAAGELVVRLADSLGPPGGSGPFELRAAALGRALAPDETLADAGLWDGTLLVLARAGDPDEPRPPPVLALARMSDQTRLPAVPEWRLDAGETQHNQTRWLIAGAVLLLLLLVAVAGVWFVRPRETPPTVAATAEAPVASEVPTPRVAAEQSAARVQVTLTVGVPTATASAVSNDETAWRDLQPQLDALWGLDWPSAIALLQNFHTQYPTRTTATDKLYAAMIEYGRALREAGANGAAADTLEQAVRLAPQRLEARSELAALTPVPEEAAAQPVLPPQPIVQPEPLVRPTPSPTAVPAAAPPPPATPTPVPVDVVADQPSPCDVQAMESACPLADGARLENTIALTNGWHYYWFGVPTTNMQVRVTVTGRAVPFALLLFSDQSSDPTAPVSTENASDSGTTVMNRVLPSTGAYVLALLPQADAAGTADLGYSLAFDLRPLPVPTVVVEEPTPLPTPAPTATPVPLVAVPPVAGRSASVAADRLRQAGLIPQQQSADRFSAAGAGTVALQDPPAGSSVALGSVVALSIATGNVVVPASAIGLAEEDASMVLRQAGVAVEIRRAHRSGVAAGRAAELSPPGGSVVEAGSVVVLTISQGE